MGKILYKYRGYEMPKDKNIIDINLSEKLYVENY